jgi:hypothetical protein
MSEAFLLRKDLSPSCSWLGVVGGIVDGPALFVIQSLKV